MVLAWLAHEFIRLASSLGGVPSQLADSKPTQTNTWIELNWVAK
jgi:hypothetical protein